MSETKSSSSEPKTSAPSAPSTPSSPDSSSGGGGGKSTRDSVGGSKEVHYGYFSSVRNENYRSGWDAIWGSKKKLAKSVKKTTGPAELYIDFEKLPDELREALAEYARKKLRRTPAGFKKLLESGSVDWSMSVRIDP